MKWQRSGPWIQGGTEGRQSRSTGFHLLGKSEHNMQPARKAYEIPSRKPSSSLRLVVANKLGHKSNSLRSSRLLMKKGTVRSARELSNIHIERLSTNLMSWSLPHFMATPEDTLSELICTMFSYAYIIAQNNTNQSLVQVLSYRRYHFFLEKKKS